MLVWRKLTSAKWEDAWMERLSFLDPERIAIFAGPGVKTIRIEAYDLASKQAAQLVQRFGGQTRELKNRNFVAETSAPRRPLRIRGKLVIVRSKSEKEKHASLGKPALVIPAAMAFGTGDHATTAACLRMLCDVSETFARDGWEMLDLGTGSGILALAARALGARRADAWDFDPACIRTARENLALNNIKHVDLSRRDVLAWTPGRTWNVVTANLYSSVLVAAAPQISRAIAPGGALIFSGVLREQEQECVRAFSAENLHIERTVRRGKWVAALARTTFSVPEIPLTPRRARR